MEDLTQKPEAALNENEHNPSRDEDIETSKDSGTPGFHKRLLERAARLPQQDLDTFPPDFSENLDHYLYGMPKKTP